MSSPALLTTWDLPRYFYADRDDPKLKQDIANIRPLAHTFIERWRGKIQTIETATDMRTYLDEYEAFERSIELPSHYFGYLSALDTQDTDLIRRAGELHNIHIELHNEMLFISEEFRTLGEEKLRIWAGDPILPNYRNALIGMADNLKYILPEDQERILGMKMRTLSVPLDLYEEFTGSFQFKIEIDGEEKTVTEEEIRTFRMSPDREVRRRAFASLRSVYNTPQTQIVLGNLYSSIVKDWVSDRDLRGYDTVMSPRNTREELDNQTVDMLIRSVEAAYPLFQRYLRAKQRHMKLDTFASCDIPAPIGTIDRKVPFEEAVALHLDTMKEFDQDFYDYSVDMLTAGRVDVYPKFGKRGGAFASYSKDSPSFVLLNYTEKIRDVSTLSHELGHAIHGHLSQVQKGAVYSSPLSLAETASIFAEMLLAERLKTLLSPAERIQFANERLGDVFATIFRQIQYITFERRVHETLAEGRELTYHEYNTLWRAEQKKMTGTDMAFDVVDADESGWSMIPHIFHTPFYCYAYSFGNILVFALYDRYRRDPSFVHDYKDILRAGGSERPRELLARYGIDITSPDFYAGALREVERMVEEFEGMEG